MVTLKKRLIRGKTYYYLSHTYREKGKIKYKETYIGNRFPKNIDAIKGRFLSSIYKEKWFGNFEKIKKAYSMEQGVLPEEVRKKELERFAIIFTYNTNRIEGSKLSFKDTFQLLELGISPKDKPIKDIKEAEAHRKVFYRMMAFKGELSMSVILEWHKSLFEDTKPGIAGQIRTYQVYISNSKHIPPAPSDLHSNISEFFKWYSAAKKSMNPVELSARAHVKFETMHPFGDGNGRVGRLIMNFILHKNGYPMLNIEYTGRRSYYNALERPNVKGDENIFVQWFFRKYLKGK